MTKKQLRLLVDELEFKNHGLLLAYFIKKILANTNLTLMQDSTLEGITIGGDYSPATFDILYKSCLEVLGLIAEGKIDTVITILKRCPVPEDNKAIQYFIGGKRCTIGDYFSGDKIKGQRRIKGILASSKKFTDMTEEEFRRTIFSKSKLGEILGLKLFGENYCEAHSKGDIDFSEPDIAEPVSKAKDSTPRQDDDEEIGANAEEQYIEDSIGDNILVENPKEFEFNKPSREPWINRPK